MEGPTLAKLQSFHQCDRWWMSFSNLRKDPIKFVLGWGICHRCQCLDCSATSREACIVNDGRRHGPGAWVLSKICFDVIVSPYECDWKAVTWKGVQLACENTKFKRELERGRGRDIKYKICWHRTKCQQIAHKVANDTTATALFQEMRDWLASAFDSVETPSSREPRRLLCLVRKEG